MPRKRTKGPSAHTASPALGAAACDSFCMDGWDPASCCGLRCAGWADGHACLPFKVCSVPAGATAQRGESVPNRVLRWAFRGTVCLSAWQKRRNGVAAAVGRSPACVFVCGFVRVRSAACATPSAESFLQGLDSGMAWLPLWHLSLCALRACSCASASVFPCAPPGYDVGANARRPRVGATRSQPLDATRLLRADAVRLLQEDGSSKALVQFSLVVAQPPPSTAAAADGCPAAHPTVSKRGPIGRKRGRPAAACAVRRWPIGRGGAAELQPRHRDGAARAAKASPHEIR
jgi:hypothetical protein